MSFYPLKKHLNLFLETFKQNKQALQKLQDELSTKEQRIEFLKFQIHDIEQHHFEENEDETLNQERKTIRSQKERLSLIRSAQSKLSLLKNESDGLIDDLTGLSDIDDDYAPFLSNAKSVSIELDELNRDLNAHNYQTTHPSLDINSIESRLDIIFKLKTKYRVQSINELLTLLQQFKDENKLLENHELSFKTLMDENQTLQKKLKDLGSQIHTIRKSKNEAFENAIKNEMKDLNFNAHSFVVDIKATDSFFNDGYDIVSFQVSTNPGFPPKPLNKVASGGELSRIMLALKTVQKESVSAPTLIFDEIDTGIGGITATKMGEKLKTLSITQQLICITHLSQIAKFSDHHLLIEKKSKFDATQVHLNFLTDENRLSEIRRMQGEKT